MLEGADVALLVALGCDALISYGLYKLYKYDVHSAEEIQRTSNYMIGPELLQKLKDAENNTIPYGCVEGIVETLGAPVCESHFTSAKGVLMNSTLTEHRARYHDRFWLDTKGVVRDLWDAVPFCLTSKHLPDHRVNVVEARSAEFLEDDLSVTYDHFEPNKSSLLHRGVERIFLREVSKGYHETERMLLVGTQILGIGTLVLDNGDVKLQSPDDGSRYILTTKSKRELIKHLSKKSSILKIFAGVFTVTGVVLILIILRRFWNKLKNHLEIRRARQEIQQARERETAARAQRARAQNASGNNPDSTNCVVCLENQREVILLECGHICLCADCALQLPQPRKCPVCRDNVVRFVPTYTP